MRYEVILIDLDDTLYSNHSGLWDAIRDRMSKYMHEIVGLPEAIIPELRRHYFTTYGTTLRGLQIHHQVNVDHYLKYVHDIPLNKYIQPDPPLKNLLESLPQRKYIFTNADANHAQRVMQTLGVEECFEGIIDVRAIDFACKPEQEAYLSALKVARVTDPARCVYLDDSPSNLLPARQMDLCTVLVGTNLPNPAACFSIPRLHNLPDAIPELWNSKPPLPDSTHSSKNGQTH